MAKWKSSRISKKVFKGKIKHSYDTIADIHSDKFGIKSVQGQENNYDAHYYVDCTGAARMLSKNLA